jgi:hypothetical protein
MPRWPRASTQGDWRRRESVTAATFRLKTRARWREVAAYEHVPAQEGITVSHTLEFIRRSLEGAEQFTAKIEEMAARQPSNAQTI